MATQTQRIAALEEGIGAILAMLQGTQDATQDTPKGNRKGTKGTKDTKGIGRESTFRKGNLQSYQGITSLKVGQTFTYNRSKGKGASSWKVTGIDGDTVHAVKVA